MHITETTTSNGTTSDGTTYDGTTSSRGGGTDPAPDLPVGSHRPAVDLRDPAQLARVERSIRRHRFAVLSSVSPAGFPHAAGIVYSTVGTTLYVHTMRASRKAANIAADGRVAVVIPTRSIPFAPPFNVQFQARATLLDLDDPEIVRAVDSGRLKGIIGHGALEEPDGCFIRIVPNGRVHTYGIGVSTLAVARDPLHSGDRVVDVR